jgi:uncharacterized protein YggE
MNEVNNEMMRSHKGPLAVGMLILALAGTAFLVTKTIKEIGGANDAGAQNTITVSGKGEAFAIPDIGMLSFDVSAEALTVDKAQADVTARMNDIIAYLKTMKISKDDIKTTNYNIYPRYEYNQKCLANGICPVNGTQVLVGYNVSHSVQVKIRKTEDAGIVLAGLGSRKVTNISGLTFMVENDKAVTEEARAKAIKDAKDQAKVLARDLGVRLVAIVSFSESGNYPVPYYSKGMAMDSRVSNEAVAPEIPTGENKITSNVSITYEIR